MLVESVHLLHERSFFSQFVPKSDQVELALCVRALIRALPIAEVPSIDDFQVSITV